LSFLDVAAAAATTSAMTVPDLRLSDDDFTLLGLPARQSLDRALLDQRWRELQQQVHPDRFAAQGAASQRLAMQWAVRVNEAYRRLKDPLRRGAYLCELRGVPIRAETNTAMPAAFLQQQMQWREALDEAEGADAVQALQDDMLAREDQLQAELASALDDSGDTAAAAGLVRALMFVRRFADEVGRRQAALDA
jgi:molecular chaperone HscB